MSATAYIEDLSPLQIASLTLFTRCRLHLRQDYSLRHVVGHILLLDTLKKEAERKKMDNIAREAFTDSLAPGPREAPHVQSSVIITVSELTDVDRTPLQEGSLERNEETCEVENSKESEERNLKFLTYVSHLVETLEKLDDEWDSDSSGESDESGSEREYWK